MAAEKEDFVNLKISVTVCLFLLTFLCSYVPWIIRIRFKASNTVMSYLNCAAGGVVLGALMMHMLPHVIEEEEQSSKKAYPYGALSAGVAFLLLFAIDRLFLCHSQQMVGKNTGKVCHDNDMLGGCHIDGIPASSSKTQAFIFVLALSVHSFFEGLGMATQDKETDLISYIISLFAHKWLEAFALGVSIMNAKFKKLAIFSLILIYSLLTPLGILFGMLVTEISTGKSRETASKILNGLAVGSFLFVSFIEMIPPEFHKTDHHSKYKFLLLVAGFAFMALIAGIEP